MVSYMLYPSNSNCDLMNVVSVIDKFLNDALQDSGVVINDNIKFYKHMIATVKEIDKKIETIKKEREEFNKNRESKISTDYVIDNFIQTSINIKK